MNANQELWEMGDFTRIAATMRRSGAELVDDLGITPGMRMLDLGCGDGTTAIPAAQLGAVVLGVDIARNLIEAGTRRASELGVDNVRFVEGDASRLDGIVDDSFDLTISIFGAMFAPDPESVAREMVRVTRPGGRIVMGNWIPGDPTMVAQVLRISAAYSPAPPPGFTSPILWGDGDIATRRFVAAGVPADRVRSSRRSYRFESPDAPAHLVDAFIAFYGPTMTAYAAAAASGLEDDFRNELVALLETLNGDASAPTSIPATYLYVDVAM